MIDLKFQVMEDPDGRIYESKLGELRKKMQEKSMRRPYSMKKKRWKKKYKNYE